MPKITRRTIEGLEPGSTAWDSEIRGFGVRCRSIGTKSYILKYRVFGRQRMFTIGRHGSPWAPDSARREAKRLLGVVASGGDPASNRAADRHRITVADVIDRFLELHVVNKKPSTQYEYRRILEKRIRPALGRLPVAKTSRSDVTKLHGDLRGKPREANHTLAIISKLFTFAEKHGMRPDGTNPAKHVERYRESRRERYLKPDEIARLHQALGAVEPEMPSVVHAIWLLHLTGMRRGEVLGLKWPMVDLDKRQLSLPDSKTGAKHVHLSRPTVELLKRIPRIAGSEFVCPNSAGGRLYGLNKKWLLIRERADLPEVRLHDLRHTYASLAVGAGISLPKIGALLGHHTPATTARYAHLDPALLRADVEKIGELLG